MEITDHRNNRVMKAFTIKTTTSGRIVLALLGITLAVGAVSCKTTIAPSKPAVNTSQTPATNQPPVGTDTGKPAKAVLYTCGMHPEVRSLDPDGKCPICQMPLIPVEDSVTKPPQ